LLDQPLHQASSCLRAVPLHNTQETTGVRVSVSIRELLARGTHFAAHACAAALLTLLARCAAEPVTSATEPREATQTLPQVHNLQTSGLHGLI